MSENTKKIDCYDLTPGDLIQGEIWRNDDHCKGVIIIFVVSIERVTNKNHSKSVNITALCVNDRGNTSFISTNIYSVHNVINHWPLLTSSRS